MSEFDRFKETYFLECGELLGELEELFTSAAEDGGDVSAANAVFRAVHSIKGGAGAFGFSDLVEFTHYFETVLDAVREGRVPFSPGIGEIGLRACDLINDLVGAAQGGGAVDPERVVAMCAELEVASGVEAAPRVSEEDLDIDFEPVLVAFDDEPATGSPDEDAPADLGDDAGFDLDLSALLGDAPDAAERAALPDVWRIEFAPTDGLYARGLDPLVMFAELAGLGDVHVACDASRLPEDLDLFAPTAAYLSWVVTLESNCGQAAIEEVFDFAIGDCELTIVRLTEPAPDASDDRADSAADAPVDFSADLLALLDDEPAPPAAAAPKPKPTVAATRAPEAAAAPAPPSVDTPAAPASPAPAPAKTATPAKSETESDSAGGKAMATIRVELDRVDRVSDMASEMVITQAGVMQQVDDALRQSHPDLVRGLEVMTQQARLLQDAIMSIRAQPVKAVFARMPRLVRQVAQETGKQVRLEMFGEQTEIDKTVIEQLADPLTHMIRNAVDHGVEAPDLRRERGKSPEGVIRLTAAQSSGRILIHVADDGGGINRPRVLEKAIAKGLVPPDAHVTDEEIDQLIFLPGFSTADKTSAISGRGVGMDVVRSNIERLGGRVNVRSTPGHGSQITLSLPLTLAVLEVLVVRAGRETFVLPLSAIVECTLFSEVKTARMPTGAPVVRMRGEYVDLVDLDAFLHATPAPADERFVVFCDMEEDGKVAFVVDGVVGQQQVAIKSLETNFERVEGLAGATIMGDGRVALILDPTGLRRRWRAGAELPLAA